MAQRSTQDPPVAASLLFGIGLGGFVDGIVLHELLQWHHMLSGLDRYPMDTVDGMEGNTVADGVFHLASWLCVLGASVLTLRAWRAGRIAPTWRFHVGLLLLGWGLFNVVEGLIDHELLGIHHVRDDRGGPLSWDIAFLALGVAQVVAGWGMQRCDVRRGTAGERRR